MKIVRKRLEAYAAATGLRYDDSTDTVQTWDGTSWIDTPDADPRNLNQFEALDTSDPRCDAAARMTAAVDEIFNALADALAGGAITGDLGAIILLWLAVFAGFAVLALLAVLVGAALLSIGSSDVSTAYNNMDWDAFQCALYEKTGADGRLTAAGLTGFQADYVSTLTATQQTIVNGILSIAGFGALNGFAATRGETGDCSSCSDAWSVTMQRDDPRLNWQFLFGDKMLCNNTVVDRGFWGATYEEDGLAKWITSNDGMIIGGQIDIPDGCTLQHITANAHVPGGSNLDTWHKWKYWNLGAQCYTNFYTHFNDLEGSIAGVASVYWRFNWTRWGNPVNSIVIDSFTFSGTGANPFL